MALSQTAVSDRVRMFRKDLDRALDLYATLVVNGRTVDSGENARSLPQPDRRDAAQFIFFEVAAKFETFMQDLFTIAVRKRYSVSPARAAYIMGHPDRGVAGVMGWGSVKQVSARAKNVFGASAFLSRLERSLGKDVYQRLELAHTLRNRVAHDSQGGASKYREALARLQVPKQSRQGASVGRVLIEYPVSASPQDRWFHRMLEAYRTVATKARTRI